MKKTREATVKTLQKRRNSISSMNSSPRSTSSPEPFGGSLFRNSQNKECHSLIFSPMRSSGLNSTPHKSIGLMSSFKPRFPLEECDPNSQDSGYGGSSSSLLLEEKQHNFQFAEPFGVAPRRLSLESRSPMKSPLIKSLQMKFPVHLSPHSKSVASSNLFRNLSSEYENTDDGFNELLDMEAFDGEVTSLPNGLASLISGEIVADKPMKLDILMTTTPQIVTLPSKQQILGLKQPIPLQNKMTMITLLQQHHQYQLNDIHSNNQPSISKVRSCLFRSPNSASSTTKLTLFDNSTRLSQKNHNNNNFHFTPSRNYKRPEPPVDFSPILVKRSRRCTSFHDMTSLPRRNSPPILQRSLSETETDAYIKSAITRSTTDSDLTGDFSKPCVLPLATGHHEDLKSISCQTLAQLIKGVYNDWVNDFKILDCRYPYEYEAGHIRGAQNLYSKEMIEKFLLDPIKSVPAIQPRTHKRSILVFHCEFSWERGPNLSRFLRNIDRHKNKEHYPALHYPEMYLLHGGYQRFFKECKELCTPQDYRPMRHPDHQADLKLFRSKSKSWQGEKTNKANIVNARTNLKRLGF